LSVCLFVCLSYSFQPFLLMLNLLPVRVI
jgi:hypothetical protein